MPRAAILAALWLAVFSAATAQAITSRQFARRADKVCKATDVQLSKLKIPASKGQVKGFLHRTIAISSPAQRKLEAIRLPKDKRATARGAVRTSREGLNLLVAVSRRIDRGADPYAEYAKVQPEVRRLAKRASTYWKQLGARACAS
jgi:hypothetical protein